MRTPPAPKYDRLIADIAEYALTPLNAGAETWNTARLCLMDALGCAMRALGNDACRRRLGPVVPGAILAGGARVPGTALELDPAQAAFNTGVLVRWLDFNDAWLAAEWGHPSDNLAAILALADYLSRRRRSAGQPPLVMHDVLRALIQAYEIQGVLALTNSFNRAGLDHVLLVRIAATAVGTVMLNGDRSAVLAGLSNAWCDGGTLRVYRHAPNTGWRKSWAAGDAAARAVRLALSAVRGEMGYPGVLETPVWGFQDALFGGNTLTRSRLMETYVMDNILFKIAFPIEFHAQTAVEAAIALHPRVFPRLHEIMSIELTTHESALRIIDKSGVLNNPADRDHCLQYGVAIGLLHGTLRAEHFEDEHATDSRIDRLRALMHVRENTAYSRDYLDQDKRAIANTVAVHFSGGASVEQTVQYPLGHRARRAEGLPRLMEKFREGLSTRFDAEQADALVALFQDPKRLNALPVDDFLTLWTTPEHFE